MLPTAWVSSQVRFLHGNADAQLTSLGASQAGHPCKMYHLHSIMYNLEEILEGYVVGQISADDYSDFLQSKYEDVLTATTREIGRLSQCPALFPNGTVRERFYEELARIAGHLQKAIHIFESFRKNQEDFIEMRAEAYEEDRLPLRDGQLKPWQQFLSKNAPGVHLWSQMIVNPGATQVVPMPGIHILLDMINGAKDIYKDIDIVSHLI